MRGRGRRDGGKGEGMEGRVRGEGTKGEGEGKNMETEFFVSYFIFSFVCVCVYSS